MGHYIISLLILVFISFTLIFITVGLIFLVLSVGFKFSQKILRKTAPILSFIMAFPTTASFIYTVAPDLVEKFILPIEVIDIGTDDEYNGNNSKNDSSIKITSEDGEFEIETGVPLKYIYTEEGISYAGYPVGCYRISEVPYGNELIQNVLKVCKRLNKNYPDLTYNIKIDILGQADAISSKNSLYLGDLGVLNKIKYFSINENKIKTRTLIPGQTHLTNEDFAILRAYDIKKTIENNEFIIRGDINIYTNISDDVGSDQRFIVIRFIIDNYDDFFKEKFNDVEKFFDFTVNMLN